MEEKKEGVIAILDMLGVKGIWTRMEPNEIIKKWSYLSEALEKNVNNFSKLCNVNGDQKIIYNYQTFSDTILIYTESFSFQSLLNVACIIGDLFALAIENGILLRGAISAGDYYYSENMIIGPGIDDAAEWYETSNWAGIHFTPKTSFFIDHQLQDGNLGSDYIYTIIMKYDVPLKKVGRMRVWTVSWPKIYLKLDEIGKLKDKEEFYLNIVDSFSKFNIGINEEKKYFHTISYLRKCIDEL